jgi:chitodextrinase
MTKRVTLAIAAGLIVFGGVFAMASSMGVTSTGQVGAGSASVSACDSDGVSTSYTTAWDTTDKRFEIASVTVSGIANTCDTLPIAVSLTDSSDVQLGSGSSTVPNDAGATSYAVSLSSPGPATTTTKIHVVIG